MLSLDSDEPSYLLGTSCYFLEDPSGTLTPNELLSDGKPAPEFRASESERLNFGYTNSTIWLYFKVRKSDTTRWLLHLATPLTEDLRLYRQRPDGTWQERYFGNQEPFPAWDIDHVNPNIYLNASAGQTATYLLRVRNKSPLLLPLYIQTDTHFQSLSRREHIAYGIYFGGLLFMALFNAFIFYGLRDLSYLYYIASILTTTLLIATISGYAFKFIFPDMPLANGYVSRTMAGLIVIFTALFAREFLNTKRFAPLMHKILAVNIGLAVIGIGLVLTDIWSGATSKVVTIQTVTLLVSGIWVWRKGNKYARFFVIAWASYIIAGLAYTQMIAGNLPIVFWTRHGMEFGSALEVILLAIALTDRYRVIRQEREEAIEKALRTEQGAAEKMERKVKERTRELSAANQELNQMNEELSAAFETVNLQKADIEKKNRDIGASINYAQRIQQAMLPDEAAIRSLTSEYFILFRPRDIVSGDFYFFTQVGDDTFVAAADCTGHGVPGAFMSMIGNDLLHQAIESGLRDPADILSSLHEGVRRSLRQRETQNQDGMTISLCRINQKDRELAFAGAKQGLFLVRNGEAEFFKGSRHEIGGMERSVTRAYQTLTFPLEGDLRVYLYSDGYPDQIGGERNRKLRSKPFRALLQEGAKLPWGAQRERLVRHLRQWMGEERQLDDILVWGMCLRAEQEPA